MVNDKEPDMFLAWNLNRYDYPKWKSRMDYLKNKCIYKFADISPMKSVLEHSRPLRVKGRIGFDLMIAFKQFTDAEIRSYALGYITEEEKLGFPKIPFEGTAGSTWDLRPDIVFMRNVYDVLIEKALDEKYELAELYDDMRKDFGALFHETFVSYRIIDSALMRLVNNKVILRTTSYTPKKDSEEKLLGAIVQEAKVGSDYWVFQFDFSREYPNIIKGFNISPETFRKKDNGNCYNITYHNPKNKEDMNFYFDKGRKGLLPTLIDFFFKKRDEYEKKRMESIEKGEPEYIIRKWERKAYNMKKKSNAIYGVMDFHKFRLSRKECTQATAVIGRIAAEELVKFIKSLGYKLKYGDTDSIFVKAKSNTPEECLKEGEELVKKLNEHLTEFFTEKYGVEKAPSDLSFQELYKKAIFFGKKNYAVKVAWNEKKGWKEDYKFKGIASVRTDSSNLERAVIEQLLKLVLDDIKVSTIKAYCKRVLKEFDNRKYSPVDVAFPSQLKKSFRYDKKKGCWVTAYAKLDTRGFLKFSAHARAAIYTNMFLNTDFVQGDKPRRLPVKFPKGFKKEQSTLFRTDKIYPSEWIYKGRTGGIKEDVTVKVKDISVVEDMHVPEFFLRNIDWNRIKKRLEGKLYMVLYTSNILKEGERLDA
jgi:DNA polymerase elongation subunit (family B)